MPRDSFPAGVTEQLKWYVYRLIDPRNGETFYVGKGQGNRVFAHAKGDYMPTVSQNTVSSDEEREDDADLKLQRIKEIKSVELDVGHVIHRHGIEQEWVAYEVEAACSARWSAWRYEPGSCQCSRRYRRSSSGGIFLRRSWGKI